MALPSVRSHRDLLKLQEALFFNPQFHLKEDYDRIYKKNILTIGLPKNIEPFIHPLVRENSVVITGVAMGDEGKGRIVDNKIQALLDVAKIKTATVVRFQGGNNAGHTVEKDGIKIDGHLVPSFYLHEEGSGIIDQGVGVHPDLETEVTYIEEKMGSIKKRLVLSEQAVLITDLERAEEDLNILKSGGQSAGGTKRGIGPGFGHHTDRTGKIISDLIDSTWKETFSDRYTVYKKDFAQWGVTLAEAKVPDFEKSHPVKKEFSRTVGTKKEFLDRLGSFREWLMKRNMVKNTFLLESQAFQNESVGMVFEGAQAAGLDMWLGTRPDVTSTDTSLYATRQGTAVWKPENLQEKIGIFKIPYMSDVGSQRNLPTAIHLDKLIREPKDLGKKATRDQRYAAAIRDEAQEFGTTTGRPRSINWPDLEMMRYNVRMSGVETLVGTHLDTARRDRAIKVCTHYTNKKGSVVPYQPGLRYLKDIVAQYVELPGWDGDMCQTAKTFEDLPENAQKFLAFLQARVGVPIVGVTSGPDRNNIIPFPGYNLTGE